jgi:hypothetical protein
MTVDETPRLPDPFLRELVFDCLCADTGALFDDDNGAALAKRLEVAPHLYGDKAPSVLSAKARNLMREYSAGQALVDEVVALFMEKADFHGPETGFEFLLFAKSVVTIGGSPAMLERVLARLVEWGWDRDAEEVAVVIGRGLTRAEVVSVVKFYITSGSLTEAGESFLLEFAHRNGGTELMEEIAGMIGDMHVTTAE